MDNNEGRTCSRKDCPVCGGPEHDARHRDEYPEDMQEVGDALGLFNDDGSLKGFDQIMDEALEDI
jgi:hypothetical protein